MRESNREAILDAAVRVADRAGVRGVTLDATAAEAGLTRGGIMYHFPSKRALSEAVQAHLIANWEDRLIAAAGAPAAECTPRERVTAYAQVATESASRAELALLLEATRETELVDAWNVVQHRWTPGPEEAENSEEALDLFLVRLAADGLWAYDALGGEPLSEALRHTIAARIAAIGDRPR